jgi:hypothetical protein
MPRSIILRCIVLLSSIAISICALAALSFRARVSEKGSDAASHVTVHASVPLQPPSESSFRGGTSTNPRGETIGLNNRYLTLDGKPWLPVMGEFHYTRVPRGEWEEQILKMKAGGVQIVSTYVIWIHHEEVEGLFDWSAQRDLRAFVQLCSQHGVFVYLRIGPWAHGEARNGGFPDWLLEKTKNVRQNDPVYLSYVEKYYAEVARQVRGLLWKDGGPVIGIQLENEYAKRGPEAGEEHIRELKRLAVADGLDVPLYSVTGWDNAVIPPGEVVSVFGGYPDAPWDSSLKDLPPQEVYAFRFDSRVSGNADLIGAAKTIHATTARRDLPFMTAEMGGGIQDTYHRRPVIQADDVAAMVPVMLSSGVNLYGSYMFQGGENPEGKRTTLQESQASGYSTDVPVKSYDFQAPLGEFGEEREVFRKLKVFNYFMNDFGAQLAPMATFAPASVPSGPDDLSVPRISVRTDGKSGFLFFNNYVRGSAMPDRRGFQATIELRGRTVKVPETPIDLPSGVYGIWPLGLELGALHLRYATAQLFTRTTEASVKTYYFVEVPGLRAEFAWEDISGTHIETHGGISKRSLGATLVQNLRPSLEPAIIAKDANGATTRLVLLSKEQAENAWKVQTGSGERLLLTHEQFFAAEAHVTLQSDGDPAFHFRVIPSISSPPAANATLRSDLSKPYASAFSVSLREHKPQRYFKQVQKAGTVPPVKIGPPFWRTQGVAMSPEEKEFALAAKWQITIPATNWNEVQNLFLQVRYDGDVARLSSGGNLLVDNFYNGQPWYVGLKRFRSQITESGLQLEILPRRADAPIFLEKSYREPSFPAGQIDELHSLKLVPQYELLLDFSPSS